MFKYDKRLKQAYNMLIAYIITYIIAYLCLYKLKIKNFNRCYNYSQKRENYDFQWSLYGNMETVSFGLTVSNFDLQ